MLFDRGGKTDDEVVRGMCAEMLSSLPTSVEESEGSTSVFTLADLSSFTFTSDLSQLLKKIKQFGAQKDKGNSYSDFLRYVSSIYCMLI